MSILTTKVLKTNNIIIQTLKLDNDYLGGIREKDSKKDKERPSNFGNVKFLSLVIGTREFL